MKIFDTFIFFNEVDLLEIRLNVLSPFVDYFVIVQSRYTFTGNEKQVIDILNLPFIKPFEHKIIHYIVEDSPYESAWDNEANQRNSITIPLKDIAKSNDIIILSDLDEIPNLKDFDFNIDKKEIWFCNQFQYYYYFNLLQNLEWFGTAIFRYKMLKKYSPQNIRDMRNENFKNIENYNIIKKIIDLGGWHFSYIANIEQIKYKLKSYSHTEYANLEDWKIEYSIKLKTDLYERTGYKYKTTNLSNLPDYIKNNKEKYKNFILEEKR